MPKRRSRPALTTIPEVTEQDRGEWKLFMEYYATPKGNVMRPPKKEAKDYPLWHIEKPCSTLELTSERVDITVAKAKAKPTPKGY